MAEAACGPLTFTTERRRAKSARWLYIVHNRRVDSSPGPRMSEFRPLLNLPHIHRHTIRIYSGGYTQSQPAHGTHCSGYDSRAAVVVDSGLRGSREGWATRL
eukprot:scaffold82418_cov60-Phaeocystis_antarctica.AAC.2